MAWRDSTATGSLMRIALGIDLALLFFAVLTLRGLQVFPDTALWLGAGGALVVIVVLLRTVPQVASVWVGHVFHAATLSLFIVDTAIGLSALVPIGFWLYAAIRGPQLDALSGGKTAEDS